MLEDNTQREERKKIPKEFLNSCREAIYFDLFKNTYIIYEKGIFKITRHNEAKIKGYIIIYGKWIIMI